MIESWIDRLNDKLETITNGIEDKQKRIEELQLQLIQKSKEFEDFQKTEQGKNTEEKQTFQREIDMLKKDINNRDDTIKEFEQKQKELINEKSKIQTELDNLQNRLE